VLWIPDSTAYDGINIDYERGKLGEILQLLIQNLETLQRNVVRLDVVDADLKMIQAGLIQRDYLLGGQQIAVGNHSRDHSVAADSMDDLLDFRMKQRFTPADRDDRSP